MSTLKKLAKQLDDENVSFDTNTLNEVINVIKEFNFDNEKFIDEFTAYKLQSIPNAAIDITTSSLSQFSIHLRRAQSVKIVKKSKKRSFLNNNNPNTNNNNNNNNNNNDDIAINKYLSMTPSIIKKTSSRSITNNNNDDDDDILMNKYLSMTPSINKKTSSRSVLNTNNKIKTPIIIPQSPSIMQSPAVNNSYADRKKRGIISVSYNKHLNNNININNKCKNLNIKIISPVNNSDNMNEYNIINIKNKFYRNDNDIKKYRFMNEDIYSKQNVIKQRIQYISKYLINNILKQNNNNNNNNNDIQDMKNGDDDMNMNPNDIQFSAVDEPSQRACYFLGRIMNDGDNSGSDKLTFGNLILEGDWNTCFGKRVKLDISQLIADKKAISLFPGQVVVIRGINTSGKEIYVSDIYQNASLSTNNKICNTSGTGSDTGSLQIFVASGPFTPKNNLNFADSPLKDLAKEIVKKRANVVVLMGPFTDNSNEILKKNDIDLTFQEVFEYLIQQFVDYIALYNFECKILIIPSTKDLHHLSSFPQNPYYFENKINISPYFSRNVYFLHNPSEFLINNISFSICSSDFLFDCCSIGIIKNCRNRLLGIITHCINQQSFYPLQPSSTSLRIDYNNSNNLYMYNKPNIFIMPSKLCAFAKKLDNDTICINPAFLTKSNTGGSYSIITIHNNNNNGNIKSFSEKTRVDIVKI